MFYQTECILKNDHHYSLLEQYEMLPYERDLHMNWILERLKKLKEATREN
jgi:hypothetical protein